jgi:tRNA-specific 2-thiouridylase
MNKSEVRAHAERVGLRTWDKPDSQDVCFIEAAKGREVFLRSRIDLSEAQVVDRASGDVVGHTSAAELMTVGQRRGVAPGRDGERRFVARVDLTSKRVEVGRLEDIMVTSLRLDESSLTFAREQLSAGTAVWAQWSAHGTPRVATLRHDEGWFLELAEAARPVAAGQTVVFYSMLQPTVVEGAALVAR